MFQSQALSILKSGKNVFLTGEPGAGKTHTINQYVKYLCARGIEPAITASTGIAATHIGGMTIHSWSGIGIRSRLEKRDIQLITSNRYITDRVGSAKVLIIDEVSMLLANTLTMVDQICQAVKGTHEPFGGMQVIFVGDFFQLPPVVKRELQEETQEQSMLLEEEEKGLFAYDSPSWKTAAPIVCYLTEQYRQDDEDYLKLLNAIRKDNFQEDHLEHLHKRKIERDSIPENVPKLYSRNIAVDTTNDSILSKLSGKEHTFAMTSTGIPALVSMLKAGCLSPEILTLKLGASVMFTKNNPKEGFVNGTLGTVVGFNTTSGSPLVTTKSGRTIEVKPMDWAIVEEEKPIAQITQLPLRLAWAITVHKSQGMSLDEAVMDLSDVFEFGQGYVALSRVRRLSGLFILGWNSRAFQVHPEVLEKDQEFRESSKKAEEILIKTQEEELKKIQDTFIINSGGKDPKQILKDKKKSKDKAFTFDEIRKKYPKAYMPWDKNEDKKLRELFLDGATESRLSRVFGRKKGAIRSRLFKMGLLNETLF